MGERALRHVLIASLGGAPQVVTEALWAMMHPQRLIDPSHRGRPPVAPAVVHILATSFARPFADVTERNAAIRAKIGELYAQYRRPLPQVEIEALRDGDAVLADIRTQRENIVYANAVTTVVKRHVDLDDTVHMLLAGGRKSMSSYDQSAMMFFGRTDDELMHVLVEPDALERCSDFWWPDQAKAIVETFQGDRFPTAAVSARVDLVNVPFVRLGVRLPGGTPAEALDYERLIEFVQFEQSAGPVVVDLRTRSIVAGSEVALLSPGHFVYFALLAIARKGGWLGVGPEDEGMGPNAGGWIALNDVRYGSEQQDAGKRACPSVALSLAEDLRDAVFDDVVDERRTRVAAGVNSEKDDWISRAIATLPRGFDGTATLRTRCADSVKEQIKNPFVAGLVAPASYGRREKAAVGLPIPADRLELEGFEAFEKWISGAKRPKPR